MNDTSRSGCSCATRDRPARRRAGLPFEVVHGHGARELVRVFVTETAAALTQNHLTPPAAQLPRAPPEEARGICIVEKNLAPGDQQWWACEAHTRFRFRSDWKSRWRFDTTKSYSSTSGCSCREGDPLSGWGSGDSDRAGDFDHVNLSAPDDAPRVCVPAPERTIKYRLPKRSRIDS